MRALAENIKKLREVSGMTQADLAKKMNLSESAIQKWESNKNTPSLEDVINICDIFGISVENILDNKGNYNLKKVDMISGSRFAHPKDSTHEIFDVGLRGNALLHRFYNAAGEAYSAIYLRTREMKNNPREREYAMIAYWNETREEFKDDEGA